jgi:NAD(P)-dependent dehydrogenase (short-subunit alcohol dehydrogenase family)
VSSNERARKAFITGGTGSVGQALVEAFSRGQYEVTFQYAHNEAEAKRIASNCNARPIRCDARNATSLPETDFSVVVNNAGINISSVLSHEVTDEDWEQTLRVNLYFPFLVTRKYLPAMIRMQWGRIVNISSIYGLRGTETNLPYNVSKHALSGLTKTLAKEYAQFGITANEICPGAIDSEMMRQIAFREDPDHDVQRYLGEVASEIPGRRMARPEEIAATAIFLASTEAQHINGASIVVDGGQIA